MRVVLTDTAKADLREIGDRIAVDSPRRAASFVRELRTAALGLASDPQRFQLIDRRPNAGIRRRVHGNYLIFYRIEVDRVEVITILHGARDYEALLFPEEPT